CRWPRAHSATQSNAGTSLQHGGCCPRPVLKSQFGSPGGSTMASARFRAKSRRFMVLSAAVAGLGTVHAHQGAAAAATGTDPAREGLARIDAGANGLANGFDSVSLSGGSNWDVTRHWFDASRVLSIDFTSRSQFDARTVTKQAFAWPVGLELK